MNGIYILLTILLYFGMLLLVARLTGRHSDNDAFFRGNRRSPWYIVSVSYTHLTLPTIYSV